MVAAWTRCADQLQRELSAQQYNTWIRPLQACGRDEARELCLLAPNRFVLDWV
ncbi:MAG TPA: DnaA N-terminal domain-containing protein, partial [Pseudomonadales bacterium]|nr:DnaA N-terminal domain-containing protein [Pseudomonadales bacterium]